MEKAHSIDPDTASGPIRPGGVMEAFHARGFHLLKGYSRRLVGDLEAISEEFNSVEQGRFNYSLMQNSPSVNRLIHDRLQRALAPLLQRLFTNFKMLSASFLIKPAGFDEEMPLHQDWTFTFENRYSPVTMWIPLQDVDAQSGALFVLPKSHLVLENFRSLSYDSARIDRESLPEGSVTPVHADRGDVLLFHPAVFHGSFPNLRSTDRVVVSATVLPLQAPYLHIKKLDGQTATIHFLEDGAFLSDLHKLHHHGSFNGMRSMNVDYRHDIPDAVTLHDLLSDSKTGP